MRERANRFFTNIPLSKTNLQIDFPAVITTFVLFCFVCRNLPSSRDSLKSLSKTVSFISLSMEDREEARLGTAPAVNTTSPDLLKNTPSNIARLEDVIEQCHARQKYLAQTRSPSDGSDVRWYFCKVPLAENELAASVPRTDVVGKSEYFRFGMRDSLAIEASFLQREDELLSLWWKEYAECSVGPIPQVNSKNKSIKQSMDTLPEASVSSSLYDVEEERVGVPVKGGLYEVDLVRRHCFPVYWNGDNRRVLRGHWFARKGGLDWLPIPETVAEQLEVAYRNKVWRRRRFQPSGLFAARVDLQGSSLGLHALFTGEDDTWEAWLNVDPSGFSGIVGYTGNGIKLRRGYAGSYSPKPTQEELRQQKEEEMDDYCSQVPVRHLVFMVHGIGQKVEKSNLVDDVGNFRQITAALGERHLTSHQRGTQRVLFIPCQWRKGLKLSGEAAVDKCTLEGVRRLREMLSATVHDVLYYMSPIYCQAIIDSVSNQLNRLYLKFIKRNPDYDGKISIYGHSLGSVLSYDILCHQHNLSSPFPMDAVYRRFFPDEESPPIPESAEKPCSSHQSPNLEPEKSNLLNNTEEITGQDNDMMDKESTVLEHHHIVQEASSSVSDSVVDNVGLERRGREEYGDHDSSGGAISSQDGPDGADSRSSGSSSSSSEKSWELKCGDSNNEDTIKLLQEEIKSLRSKVAQLQSENARILTDEKAKAFVMPEQQHINGKALTKDANGPTSFTPYIKYQKLEFKVDTFFAVGSPLGVFLALRNIRIGIGKGRDYWEEENVIEEMPACRRMFNIFHPYDPVAYRVEPLVCKEYLPKRPVIVPYHRGGKRLHIGLQDFKEDFAARSHRVMNHFDSVRTRVLTICQSKISDRLEESEDSDDEKDGRSYGSLMMERLTGTRDGRIDHMLQDKTFEHPYLQAIGAHTNYWRDNDTALFIIKHLYRELPDEPYSPTESTDVDNTPKDSSTHHSWIDRSETDDADEELPLTFSNRESFYEDAKKYLKKP
ncbi:Phospholipase SGR2 [Raphanus sativus]|uniref:Phospholipase SGR2 isoform X2 n=1 Tax=Raphanus sativus TaxID=3726 RepID=A0A9W3BS34_RAPSA|nr:phospholipase SGR2 isoform X2 [Raphanus sativus]KAJ4916987.1 Phospholipase SGR2 [Raphanus sativus]